MGLEVLPLFILFGLALSLPAFLVYFAVYQFFIVKISSPILIKLLLNTIAVGVVLITFTIISGSLAYRLSFIYSASVVIASSFYSVKREAQ